MAEFALPVAAVSACLAVLFARESYLHTWLPFRGRMYLKMDQPELAAAAWRTYLGTRTLFGRQLKRQARFSLAHCLYRLGRFDDALADCEALLATSPGPALVAPTQQLRADCLLRLNRLDEAREARHAAAEAYQSLHTHSLFASELEVDRREADGDWAGALEQLEELVQEAIRSCADSYLQIARVRLARMRLQLGYDEAAQLTAETLLSRAGLPTELQHDAHAIAARAYLQLERFEQAERDAEAAFRISNLARDRDKLIDDCLLLAEVAQHQGDYVTGMKQFQRVRECGGAGRWLAALGEAETLDLWGREKESAESFEQAWKNLPDGPSRPQAELVTALSQAAALYPRDAGRAGDLLATHRDQPVTDPRLALRRAALLAMTDTAAGRHELAAGALEELARGREAFAHDRHLLADLDLAEAEVALLQGRLADAEAHLQAALARPCYRLLRPSVLVQLGRVRQAAGRHEAAREVWQEAAAWPVELGAVSEARTLLG